MPKFLFGVSPTSVILRVKLLNSSVSTGAGLTGLTSASTGLNISTIKMNDATTVSYTAAGSTIETISTLGTYAAPTATKCRFKEVDATNHPGVYEIQLADARFASTDGLIISISGATNLAQCDIEVECKNLAANVIQVDGTAQTARDIGASVLVGDKTGFSLANGSIAAATFASGAIDATAFAQAAADKVWATTSRTLSAFAFTVATNSDSNVTAIKTQTDKMAFTVANQIDCNVIDWKGSTAPAMTGDAYAIVNNGTYGNSALNTAIGTRLATSGYTAPDNTNIGNIYNVVKSGGTGDNAAIKAQTDEMQFDESNNIKSIKNATDGTGVDFSAVEKASITSAVPDATAVGSAVWNFESRTLSGTTDANLVSINGQLTSGNNATLKLKQLSIVNASGIAVDIESGGSSQAVNILGGGDGMYISGNNSSGAGITIVGAAGVSLVGLNGVGASIQSTAGIGLDIRGVFGARVAGSAGYGLLLQGISDDDLKFATPACTIPALSSAYDAAKTAAQASVLSAVKTKTDQLIFTGGYVNGQVKGMDTDVISAAAISAAAVTKIQTGLANSSDMTTINGKLDTIYSTEGTIINSIEDVNSGVTTIVDVLPSSGKISNLALTDNIDGGVTFINVLTGVLAMTSGRFKKDYPSSGQVTFYKRDNATTAFIVAISDAERTRV